MLRWLRKFGIVGTAVNATIGLLTGNWALAMSVAIGIAASWWAWATQWGPVPVALFGLFAFGLGVWTLNGIIWFRRRNKPSKTKMTFDYSNGIDIETVGVGIDDAKPGAAFQVGLVIRNVAPVALKFEVEDFDVVVGGRTITNPVFTNTGGSIPFGGRRSYFYPPFDLATLQAVRPRAEGKIKCRIKYGHPDSEFVRVAVWKLAVSYRLDDKPGAVFLIESEKDEEL